MDNFNEQDERAKAIHNRRMVWLVFMIVLVGGAFILRLLEVGTMTYGIVFGISFVVAIILDQIETRKAEQALRDQIEKVNAAKIARSIGAKRR